MNKKFKFFGLTLFIFSLFFTINNNVDAADVNLVKNGDFEAAELNWNGEYVGADIYSSSSAISGKYHNYVGWKGDYDSVYQQGIVIPSDVTNLELEFKYYFAYFGGTATITFHDEDDGMAVLGGVVFDSTDYDTGDSIFISSSTVSGIDDWKGKNVTIAINVDNSGSSEDNTIFIVDDIKFIATTPSINPTPVYRFWSSEYKGHFYTASETEKNNVIAKYPTLWKYEGVAYYAYTTSQPGTVPVYRFWSSEYKGHFYTASETEKNNVIAKYPTLWKYEGPVFYVYSTQQNGTKPIYRFWSSSYLHHFYTGSGNEKNNVIAKYPTLWKYEGPVWYVFDIVE